MEKENNLKLITVRELGEILRVKKSAIYNLKYRRKIAFVRVGAKTLFKLRDVQEYIDKNTYGSADQQIKKINENRKKL